MVGTGTQYTYKTGPKIPRNTLFEKIPIPPKKINKARELYARVIFAERRIDSFEIERRPPRAIQSQPTITHEHEEHNPNAPASGTSEDISGGVPEFPPKRNTIYRGRRQGPLGPYERAHALLIRHLGACPRCRRKKVQCSLDHHDLSSLGDTNILAPSASSASPSSDNTGNNVDNPRSDELPQGIIFNQNAERHRNSGRNPSMADLLIPQDSAAPAQSKISGANFPYETNLFKNLSHAEKDTGKKQTGLEPNATKDDAWSRRPLSGEAPLSGKVASPLKIVDDACAVDFSRKHDISKGSTSPRDGIIITDPDKLLSQQDWLNRAVSRSLEESKKKGKKKEEEFSIEPNDPMEIMRRRFLEDDFRRQQSAKAAKAQEKYSIKGIGYNILSPTSGQFHRVQQSYRQPFPSSLSVSGPVACGNSQQNGQKVAGDSVPEDGSMPSPNAATARLREIWTNAEEITHSAPQGHDKQSLVETDTRPPPSWAALNHPIHPPISSAPDPRTKSADGTTSERPRKKVKYISVEADRNGRYIGVNGNEISAESYLITHHRAQSNLPASATTVPGDFLFASRGSSISNGYESPAQSKRVVGAASKVKSVSKKRTAEDMGSEGDGDAKRSRLSSSNGFASEGNRKEDPNTIKNDHGRDEVMISALPSDEIPRSSDESPKRPQPTSSRSQSTKNYICKYCDIEFSRYQDLKSHLRLHDLSQHMDSDVEELVVKVSKARGSHSDELLKNEEVDENGDVILTSSDALGTEPIFKRLYRVLKNKVWGD